MSWFPVVLMASAARGHEPLHVLALARPSFSCLSVTWGSGAVSCPFGPWRGCRCSERGQRPLSHETLQLALALMGEGAGKEIESFVLGKGTRCSVKSRK